MVDIVVRFDFIGGRRGDPVLRHSSPSLTSLTLYDDARSVLPICFVFPIFVWFTCSWSSDGWCRTKWKHKSGTFKFLHYLYVLCVRRLNKDETCKHSNYTDLLKIAFQHNLRRLFLRIPEQFNSSDLQYLCRSKAPNKPQTLICDLVRKICLWFSVSCVQLIPWLILILM